MNEGFLYAFIYYYKRIDKHGKFIKFIVLCTEAPYQFSVAYILFSKCHLLTHIVSCLIFLNFTIDISPGWGLRMFSLSPG